MYSTCVVALPRTLHYFLLPNFHCLLSSSHHATTLESHRVQDVCLSEVDEAALLQALAHEQMLAAPVAVPTAYQTHQQQQQWA